MSDYYWARVYRGRLWHVMDFAGIAPHEPRPIPLCGGGAHSGTFWAEWEPLLFGRQEPPRRSCSSCVDRVIRGAA